MIDINELREDKRPQSSTVVHALLDRLEAAEKDAAHQKALAESALRVAGGWERKCGELRAVVRHEADCVEAAKAEIEVLRAKIEQMELQEPVGHVWRCDNGHIHGSCNQALPMGTNLYALPCAQAQPAPSVPDGWKLVPIISTHEMKEAGACAGAVYYAIAKDVWSAMLAAAPKLEGE